MPIRRRSHPRPPRKIVPGAAPGQLRVPVDAKPTVLQVLAYGPDGVVEAQLDKVSEIQAYRKKWPVVWLDVRGLGDGKALRRLAELFDIHRLALEDVVNVPQRPKIETYRGHHFLVAQPIDKNDLKSHEQLSLFVGDGFVLTVQEREGDWFDGVRDRIRSAHGLIRRQGSDYLLYALLDAAVDSYFPALEKLGEELETLEERIMEEATTELVSEVRELKRVALVLRRQAWPQREMVGQLLRTEETWIGSETRTHLRDCYDHAVQVLDLLENHREMASSLLDFHMTVMGQRMNEIMKVLTIMASLFIPLSFLAGLYGMNFDTDSPWNLPELGWRYGYPMLLGVMAATATGMLYYFRRKGWLGGTPRNKPPS